MLLIASHRWNFSVGAYDVSYMEHPEHIVSCNKYAKYPNLEMRFNLAYGLLEAINLDSEDHIEWSVKFDSPIADVWRFHDKVIQPVDVFRHGLLRDVKETELPEGPLLYLGMHALLVKFGTVQFSSVCILFGSIKQKFLDQVVI